MPSTHNSTAALWRFNAKEEDDGGAQSICANHIALLCVLLVLLQLLHV